MKLGISMPSSSHVIDSKYYGNNGEMMYYYLTDEGRKYYREIGKIRKKNLFHL